MIATLLLVASGCTGGTQAGTRRDAAGRMVEVPSEARRIVTMAPGVTEIVDAAGAFDRIVGVTDADNHPPAVAQITMYSALPVDFEAVVRMQPDLVLAALQVNSTQNAAKFESLGIPVFYLASGSVEEILDSIRQVGELAGTGNQAAATVDSLRGRIDALKTLTAGVVDPPDVLFLISDVKSWSFGPESYIHDLIEWAGGRSLTREHPVDIPVLSEEFVVDSQPDVIIGTFGPDYDPAAMLDHHPAWSIVPAIKNDRVYSVDGDLTLRAGPRVIEGAWRMARLLHPELFEEDGDRP